jgi:hypothetical protein
LQQRPEATACLVVLPHLARVAGLCRHHPLPTQLTAMPADWRRRLARAAA